MLEKNSEFMVYHHATPPQEKSSYFSTETGTTCPVFSPIWKFFVQLTEPLKDFGHIYRQKFEEKQLRSKSPPIMHGQIYLLWDNISKFPV